MGDGVNVVGAMALRHGDVVLSLGDTKRTLLLVAVDPAEEGSEGYIWLFYVDRSSTVRCRPGGFQRPDHPDRWERVCPKEKVDFLQSFERASRELLTAKLQETLAEALLAAVLADEDQSKDEAGNE